MRKLIRSIEDAAGRTIVAAHRTNCGTYFSFIFKDDTALVVEARPDWYDEGDVVLSVVVDTRELRSFAPGLNICSWDEWDEIQKREDAELAARREAAERRKLAELKEKYEG